MNIVLVLLSLQAQVDAGPEAAPPPPTPLEEAAQLLQKHDLKSFEKALAIYEGELKTKPDDLDVQLGIAESLNSMMRVRTNNNLVLVEGASDTDANKKIWASLAPRANELAIKVVKARPKDTDALLAAAEAYMYVSSSLGIIQAIMDGAADQYKRNADALIANKPKKDPSAGDIYHGAFFIVAPWPMSDLKKAREHFRKALALGPSSVRNHYYNGLGALRDNDLDTAEAEFTFASTKPCVVKDEQDFCGALKAQAKLGLDAVKKKR